RPDAADVRVVVLAQATADVSGSLAELGQVLPDAEAAACAGEDDRTHGWVARVLEARRERAVHVGVEGVEEVRTVERDRQDRAVAAGLDLGHRPDFRRSTL